MLCSQKLALESQMAWIFFKQYRALPQTRPEEKLDYTLYLQPHFNFATLDL